MDKLKPILLGVSDYGEIRKRNGYFVDHTDLIADLDRTFFAVFLRPRRFGKSLMTSILRAYYDIRKKDQFDFYFKGTKIGANPTEERNKYLVLYFNFSAVKKNPAEVQDHFRAYCCICFDTFMCEYASLLPDAVKEEVAKQDDPGLKLMALSQQLASYDLPLMTIIDEYDNFANTILAEHGRTEYEALCHGDGFFKQFFIQLKAATTGLDAPMKRLFITGVTPVTMDDVTSGFNIGTNLSLDPTFADLMGFTHDDVREMLAYYRDAGALKLDADELADFMTENFNGFSFCGQRQVKMCNPMMVLSYLAYILRNGMRPTESFDENVRTDYAKVKHLITIDNRLGPNFSILERIVRDGEAFGDVAKSFQARDMHQVQNFQSILFYFGMISYAGTKRGLNRLSPPNRTLRTLMNDMLTDGYRDAGQVDTKLFDLAEKMARFAYDGEWRPAIETLAQVVSDCMSVRDAAEGEKVAQAMMVALLYGSCKSLLVDSELEANHGYVDIALAPNLALYPDMAYAGLIELKYVKKDDPLTSERLAQLKAEAAAQLDRYAADHNLAQLWHLKSGNQTISLIRLSVVFHGPELALAEEV